MVSTQCLINQEIYMIKNLNICSGDTLAAALHNDRDHVHVYFHSKEEVPDEGHPFLIMAIKKFKKW